MKVAWLKVGDVLEDYRRGVVFTITRIAPCGSCSCGNGEISYEERRSSLLYPNIAPRKCGKTFKQFERLLFIRRLGDRVK